MRALFGLDPDDGGRGAPPPSTSSARSTSTASTTLGPGAARAGHAMAAAAARRAPCSTRSISGEIAAPPAHPATRAQRHPLLLIDARDEDGAELSDMEIRDQVMTLLFAGHDTIDLDDHVPALRARAEPGERWRSSARSRIEVLGGDPPVGRARRRRRAPLPRHGPRRDAAPVSAGLDRAAPRHARLRVRAATRSRRAPTSTTAPGRATACPRCSREPEAFIPERFERERKAALPKGAYVPFGGGLRICIGKRFGQTEVRVRGDDAPPAVRDGAARRPHDEHPADADALPGRRARDAHPTARARLIGFAYYLVEKEGMAMLKGNGSLDTPTHRLVNRVMDEIQAHRLDPRERQAFPVRGAHEGVPRQAASKPSGPAAIRCDRYSRPTGCERGFSASIDDRCSQSFARSSRSPPSQVSLPRPPLSRSKPSPPKSWSSPIWP